MALTLFFYGFFQCVLGLYEIYTEARNRKENKKRHYDFRETISNLSDYNLNIFRLLLVIPAFFIYKYLYSLSVAWHFSWSKSATINFLIAFVLADFVFYWFHVLSHRWNLLWGAHSVHHQPTYFNLSIGGRDSIYGRSFLYIMALPLALTGLDPVTYFSAAHLGIIYMGFTHTLSVGRLGILEYFMSTPHHHKIHHYKDISRLGGNRNLGGVFIIWDRIFGTFWEEKKEAEGNYEFGTSGVPAVYSPLKCQTFFYRHLFKLFFKVPLKDRLKLLFSHYLPEPIPLDVSESSANPHTFSYYDWFFSFLLLLFIYQTTSTLTVGIALRLALAEGVFDTIFFIKLAAACVATFWGAHQISKILTGRAGISSRARQIGLLLTITAASLAFVFLSRQVADDHRGVLNFVLGSRVFLALGALIALR